MASAAHASGASIEMNLRELSFDQIHALRTYSVIRSHRGKDPGDVWEKVEVSGLSWEVATAKENELEKAEQLAHPELTFWTRDAFIRKCEQGDEINAELHRRRMERCGI